MYACFVSYCHGQYDLVKGFIDQLKTALKSELDALMDEELYIDEERLRPGYHYNEELARAICQSVCMVVVVLARSTKGTSTACASSRAWSNSKGSAGNCLAQQLIPRAGSLFQLSFEATKTCLIESN